MDFAKLQNYCQLSVEFHCSIPHCSEANVRMRQHITINAPKQGSLYFVHQRRDKLSIVGELEAVLVEVGLLMVVVRLVDACLVGPYLWRRARVGVGLLLACRPIWAVLLVDLLGLVCNRTCSYSEVFKTLP